ncbi:DUF4214 domain-containing protein [Nonomuraea sp. NPDC051941]|uniref:DUF4214 domain-containing protein n=1 Tax=Nonomuraea sp. NPDC051941 TaxID=3364373 RepID=UPI0037CA4E04
MRRTICAVLAFLSTCLSVGATPATAAGKVPAQFFAKLYSEALGRMPDPSGWSAAVGDFAAKGCTPDRVRDFARGFYTSAEFMALNYDAEERVLALYRDALNREPDRSGFDHFTGLLTEGARSWPQIVDAIVSSGELASLAATICGSSTSYHYGTAPALTLTPKGAGFAGGTGEQLQALLDATPEGGTVYLAEKAVVRVGAMLVIPPGRTLATTGTPSPREYARQGRLVRASSFGEPVVRLQSGARLRGVWVDGQRGAYTNFTLNAINVQLMGGDGTEVSGSKISDSRGWSSLLALGSGDNRPCPRAVISGNLVTAYSSEHVMHDGVGRWTDGISVSCENAVVEGNGIVDATDVGIVLFRSSPATQRSSVQGNVVLNAGNAAYGAIVVDPLYGGDVTHDFTGATVSGNAFWTGPDTHADIGIAAGTRMWFGERADDGAGVSVRDNTTNGLTAVVGTGIAVGGMNRATVQGNDLRLSVRAISSCPHVNFGVDQEGHAQDGDFQPGATPVDFTNPSGGGCIGH